MRQIRTLIPETPMSTFFDLLEFYQKDIREKGLSQTIPTTTAYWHDSIQNITAGNEVFRKQSPAKA